MGQRLIDATDASNVILLWEQDIASAALSQEDESLPEPPMLYGLIVLAFLLHKPHSIFGGCVTCGEGWPCPQLRLAYRLRESQ